MSSDPFIAKAKHPTDADLKKRLGPSHQLYEKVLAGLESEQKGISTEWKYSARSGWYLTCNKGKRRLFYFFPVERDFIFKLVLNDKALAETRAGGFPGDIPEMIAAAKKYPEGTLLEFGGKGFSVDTVMRLLRIKIRS